MWRTAFMNEYLEIRPLLHECARGAGMVEMDVSEQQCARSPIPQFVEQPIEAGGGSAIDEHIVDLPRSHALLQTNVVEINQPHVPPSTSL